MELIPILSFIILVATISTFILAVGAYILYKIRESKGRKAVTVKSQSAEAELYAPAQITSTSEFAVQSKKVRQEQPQIKSREQARPLLYETQQERSYQPQDEKFPNGRVSAEAKRYQVPNQAEGQEQDYQENGTDKKFMKYTSDGYVPVSKSKTGENLKWR